MRVVACFMVILVHCTEPFYIGGSESFILTSSDAFWASFIAEVEEISVTSIYYLIPALFACIALWTILYNATLPDKEKAERLKMIG